MSCLRSLESTYCPRRSTMAVVAEQGPMKISDLLKIAHIRFPDFAAHERTRVEASASTAAPVEGAATTSQPVIIPGGKGKAAVMKKGETIKIVNIHGTQVVDFWAFATEKWGKEIMSMHHTRNALCRTTPRVSAPLRFCLMSS